MIGAELSGVALEGSAKERFNAVQQELALLSTTFSNNLLDATKKWARLVIDPTEMDGLPPSARGLAAQTAVAKVRGVVAGEGGRVAWAETRWRGGAGA